MSRDYETLRVEDQGGGLSLLVLNRPHVANAMNTQMGRDLLAFFEEVNADPLAHRAIVVTGAGDKAFCAGGDLKERQGMSDEAWQAQHLVFERMVRAFIACPVPVIGAINGAAGTQTLPRAVGERRAKELILTGRPFSAAEAFEWGMINRVSAPGALREE